MIGIDSTSFEKVLLQHQEKLENALSDHSVEKKDLGSKLEEAKAYPIWALIIFGVSILLNGVLAYILLF